MSAAKGEEDVHTLAPRSTQVHGETEHWDCICKIMPYKALASLCWMSIIPCRPTAPSALSRGPPSSIPYPRPLPMSSPTSPSYLAQQAAVDPKAVSMLADLGISDELARLALQVSGAESEGVGSLRVRLSSPTALEPLSSLRDHAAVERERGTGCGSR
jgi:hypothetical protein